MPVIRLGGVHPRCQLARAVAACQRMGQRNAVRPAGDQPVQPPTARCRRRLWSLLIYDAFLLLLDSPQASCVCRQSPSWCWPSWPPPRLVSAWRSGGRSHRGLEQCAGLIGRPCAGPDRPTSAAQGVSTSSRWLASWRLSAVAGARWQPGVYHTAWIAQSLRFGAVRHYSCAGSPAVPTSKQSNHRVRSPGSGGRTQQRSSRQRPVARDISIDSNAPCRPLQNAL